MKFKQSTSSYNPITLSMLWNSHLTHFAGQGHELCIVPEKSSISRFKTTTHYPASVSITKMNCWMGNIWVVMVLTSLFVCCVKSLFCAILFCLLKQQRILWLFRGWKWCSWLKVVWYWNYRCGDMDYASYVVLKENHNFMPLEVYKHRLQLK